MEARTRTFASEHLVDLLVTGATGYVGGRLVPRLLAEGHTVRCLVRDPRRLTAPWRAQVQVITGAVEDEGAVLRAADGADAAYYLVHAMEHRVSGLLGREVRAAASFREGAVAGGVRRIVYLGGLVDEADLARTSAHLYARQQAGQTLRDGPVPVTELRAGIVIGAGSSSFALLRTAASTPVTISAPLTRSSTQPLAEADLLDLLVAVVDDPRAAWQVLDVGGPDVLSYGELVARVRAAMGSRPAVTLPHVPYLPPELAATGAAILSRLDPTLVLPLLRSAEEDAVVRDAHARDLYPDLAHTSLDDAIAAALAPQHDDHATVA
ncbi:MAG: NmrA family NAD(P)-binding protein [Nitriliruptor sp.]